jgi:hypothetical protein
LEYSHCGDKKATTLEELKKKYDGKEFKDCDEFIAAAEEMIDVYFATIDKAVNGDENAKKELDEFDKFMDNIKDESEKFEDECPDKFKAFEDKFDAKMKEYMPKIIKLYEQIEFDENMENIDWEEEWEEGTEIVEDVTN